MQAGSVTKHGTDWKGTETSYRCRRQMGAGVCRLYLVDKLGIFFGKSLSPA